MSTAPLRCIKSQSTTSAAAADPASLPLCFSSFPSPAARVFAKKSIPVYPCPSGCTGRGTATTAARISSSGTESSPNASGSWFSAIVSIFRSAYASLFAISHSSASRMCRRGTDSTLANCFFVGARLPAKITRINPDISPIGTGRLVLSTLPSSWWNVTELPLMAEWLVSGPPTSRNWMMLQRTRARLIISSPAIDNRRRHSGTASEKSNPFAMARAGILFVRTRSAFAPDA